MELSSELIEIESQERKIWTSHFAKVCAACVLVLLVIVAFVLLAGLPGT